MADSLLLRHSRGEIQQRNSPDVAAGSLTKIPDLELSVRHRIFSMRRGPFTMRDEVVRSRVLDSARSQVTSRLCDVMMY